MSAATYEDGPKVISLTVRRKPPMRALVVLGIAVVLAVGGVAWLRAPKATVTTENAYLKSDRTMVAPRVKGLIAQVLVADNQTVVAGQPLIVLDPEEYAARLAAAQG
ncbi:MAG: biotin/lipoyl-binding protein, partial [Phenylobacterium sp.]|uniref:biotin/lipoyl-binding protein n=1 Tax=Phenylobacterium sp. TaxID=1871053 RepID=UPI003BB4B7B5